MEIQNQASFLGAIVGDIAGSRFEWCNIKSKDFTLLVGRGEDADECCLIASFTPSKDGVKEAISRMRRSH